MNRILLTLLVSLMSLVEMTANPITANQAREKVKDFMNARVASKARGVSPSVLDLKLSSVGRDDSYYVFNIGKKDGFVIVSGEDETEEILGYADDGNFDAENVPDGLQYLMECYAEEIKWVRENKKYLTRSSFEDAFSTIQLDESRLPYWYQRDPFNRKCPVEGGIAGCGPIAMAQLMFYHKFPAVTKSEIPSHLDGTASIAAGTALNWDLMTNDIQDMTTPAQKDAAANLGLYCGLALSANYNVGEKISTGSNGQHIVYALAKYFGYNPSMEYLDRNNYSSYEWQVLIHTELSKNRPVLYRGHSSGAGHVFLLYGYDHGLYYVNFGWGRNSGTGFYRLSVADTFTPREGYKGEFIKYNFDQGAIVGVSPYSGSSSYQPRLTVKGMGAFSNQVLSRKMSDTKYPAFSVKFDVKNWNPVTLRFGTGCALFQNGVQVGETFWSDRPVEDYPKNGVTSIEQSIQIGSDIPDGKYRLCPVSREEGQTEPVEDYASDHYYVEVKIEGGNMSLKAHNSDGVQLRANSFALSEGIVQKETLALEFEATLENTSEIDYNGDIKVCTSTSGDNKTVLATTQVTIAPGEKKEITLSYVPHEAGSRVVYLLDKVNNKLGEETINVQHAENLSVVSYTIDDLSSDGKTLYGKSLTGKATVKNEDTLPFQNSFSVLLFCDDSQSGSGYVLNAEIASGSSKEFELSFPNLIVGNRYHLEFTYSDTQVFYETPVFVCAEPLNDGYKVGDVFKAKTVEGIEVSYQVTSLSPKTVAASSGSDEMWAAAIDKNTTGPLTIPLAVNGYAVTAIAPYAFCKSGITSVTIPALVESIGRGAFFSCSSLKEINGMERVEVIDEIAFRLCSNLEAVTLPSTLTTIGSQAFGSCEKLESIVIPASTTSIDANGLFMMCDNLKSIRVEDSNPVYDSRGNCNAIIETATNTLLTGCITTSIPVNIVKIESQAMQGFSGLKDIKIPASVTEIGSSAFAFCIDLTSITCLVKEPFAIEESTFSDYYGGNTIYNNATLYVPDGTKATYKKTAGWKKFTRIVELGEAGRIKGDVNRDKVVNVADIVSVVNNIGGVYSSDADVNGDTKVTTSDIRPIVDIIYGIDTNTDPNAVDLGLSVKWCMMNVGASKPEEYGGYYAWAETAEKSSYSWDNYKYGKQNDLTKYCLSASYGSVDGKSVIEPMDDVARVRMGKQWRIPTKSEMEELITNCTWHYEKLNGVNGFRVTGPNGNSIFMPCAGQKYDNNLANAGGTGFYWTSGLSGSTSAPAMYCYNGADPAFMDYTRKQGMSIRPVLKRSDEQDDPRMDDVVPEKIREKMRDYMPIYNGINPPDIEGAYLLSPYTTVFCEDGYYKPGRVIDTYKIQFSNQNFDVNSIDMIDYNVEDSRNYSIGNGAFISGDGSNFTAFFSTEGYTKNIYTRTALVISGTKKGDSLQDLYYGFVMVAKGDDPDHKLMDVGVFRIFKDGDRISETTTWEFVNKARAAIADMQVDTHHTIFDAKESETHSEK